MAIGHARKTARNVMWRYRLATAALRSLPDFVIMGAQRCGTTYLYNLLIQHPNVIGPFRKEVHFFDNAYARGLGWYRGHFPLSMVQSRLSASRGPVLTFEASPYYMAHPHAPRRLAETLPDAKLIVLLREPVSRAYSHYWHLRAWGVEKRSFEEAIEWEEEKIAEEGARLLEDESYHSFLHQHLSYIARGVYVDHLRSVTKYIDPARILILHSQELYADGAPALQKVLRFVGLPEWTPTAPAGTNSVRYGEPMKEDLKERLRAYYRPHNERLWEFLGQNWGW